LISLFDLPGSKHGRRAIRPTIFGAVALAAVIGVVGCGGSSSAGTGSSSGTSSSGTSSSGKSSSGTSLSSSLQKCLEEHGVTAPQGAGGGGAGGSSGATPQARPTGSASSSFKQAMEACRGSGGSQSGSAG
jgi:hypothetical protein